MSPGSLSGYTFYRTTDSPLSELSFHDRYVWPVVVRKRFMMPMFFVMSKQSENDLKLVDV